MSSRRLAMISPRRWTRTRAAAITSTDWGETP
jgi:hypothetical protein